MPVVRFLAARVAGIVIALCAVVAVAYIIMFFAPGGPYSSLAVTHPEMIVPSLVQGTIQTVRDMMTFHLQVPPRFFMQAFSISFTLAMGSLLIAAAIGLPLGVFAAVKARHWLAPVATLAGLIAQGMPPYTVAFYLQLVFGVFIPILPLHGWGGPSYAILPMCALAAANIGYFTKFMQAGMNQALRQDYLVSAKARGLPGWRLVLRHALRPALVSVITFFGPQTAMVIANTVVVETLFQIPGMSSVFHYTLSALGQPMGPGTQGDMHAAIASLFVLSILVMLLNLLVDILYRALDPRLGWSS